ncbi:unnamed protein product [Tetraodon nigroviridis]|uniref:(spotted green pufferfish) hypothetical protein n=1 Tax=Tetraodon nigroviridis TaxID=99883 RepID=Q4SGM0_TETNG|nr:unnamed protein product [Tetraodon nigroviridis]
MNVVKILMLGRNVHARTPVLVSSLTSCHRP